MSMVTKLLLEGDDLSPLGVYTDAFRNLASALIRITSVSRDVSRDANKVADVLAKFACGVLQDFFW